MKPERWSAEEWATQNVHLEARAEWACERCGSQCGPAERHHRKRRREGGDSLANLVFVGRPCHSEIHAHPVDSRRQGFIVSVSREPLDVPVMWRRREWMQLDNEGNKTPLSNDLWVDAHEGPPPVEEISGGPVTGRFAPPSANRPTSL